MSKKRIELLDAIRGAALYYMLYYHFIYDLALFGLVSWDFVYSGVMLALEVISASAFILLAGFSCRLSRNNLKRGIMVFLCGLLVSVGSGIAGVTIRFGVLQLLGSSMVLYAIFGKYIERLPRPVVPIISIPMFCWGFYVYRNVRVSVEWLYPIGLKGYGFASADYFPLFPWFFMFIMGAWLSKVLLGGEHKAWMDRSWPKALTVPGRHTLIVYMVHQIPLYAIAWGLSAVI